MNTLQSTVQNLPATQPLPANVAAFVQDSRSENTKRAYRSDWSGFSAWCDGQNVQALPATPETVAAYIADLATGGAKASTIGRKVASISTAHKMAGKVSPCGAELVLSTLKGIRRTISVAPTKKAPVRVVNLRAAALTGDAATDARNRALLLLGYAGGFRRSELVGLNVQDVEETAEGMIVTVRRSKTDQEGRGHRKGIPYGSNPATCPVRALKAWISMVPAGGALFVRVRKGGQVTGQRLTAQSVALIVKDLAPSMGLDPSAVSGHSMRAGFVTDAYAVGAPEAAIMATTGHRSHAVMQGYRREANLFRQNAAAMVGL